MTGAKVQEGHSKERRSSSGPIWLTVYSDLMTNLMLFFLMLFAVSRYGVETQERIYKALQKEFASHTVKKTEESAKKKEDEMIKNIEASGLSQFARIRISEQRVKIMLPDPVLFDPGNAHIKEGAHSVLGEIAQFIADIPNGIMVEGHTDNIPIRGGPYRSNWQLSTARAFSVINYFVKQEGIQPERLSAVGYGEFRPLYPNDTDENRAHNRRIEINILRIP